MHSHIGASLGVNLADFENSLAGLEACLYNINLYGKEA